MAQRARLLTAEDVLEELELGNDFDAMSLVIVTWMRTKMTRMKKTPICLPALVLSRTLLEHPHLSPHLPHRPPHHPPQSLLLNGRLY